MSGLYRTIVAFGSSALKMLFGSRNGTRVRVTVPIKGTGHYEWNVQPDGFRPSWIVIHHSMGLDGTTRDWDGIRKYHMSYRYAGDIITAERYQQLWDAGKRIGLEKPWADVGYHFGIEDVGGKVLIMNGRPIGAVGAHQPGFNSKSIAICVVGNYDREPPSNEKLWWASSLCRQLQLEFKIPRDQVIGHRECYGRLTPPQPVAKSCPGTKFDMDAFRARLRDVPERKVA